VVKCDAYGHGAVPVARTALAAGATWLGVAVPEGITAVVEMNGQKVVVSGRDRHQVGQFASEIRGLRLPEPYKGKGIRYEDEKIRKKVGKTGVK